MQTIFLTIGIAIALLVLQLTAPTNSLSFGIMEDSIVRISLGWIAVSIVSVMAIWSIWLPDPAISIRLTQGIFAAGFLLSVAGTATPFTLATINYEEITFSEAGVTIANMIIAGISAWYIWYSEVEYKIRYEEYRKKL